MKVNPILPTANVRNQRQEKKRIIREILIDCFNENLPLEQFLAHLKPHYKCSTTHTIYQAVCNNAPDLKDIAKAWVKEQPKNHKKGYIPADRTPTVGEDLLGLKLIEQGMRYDEYV